VIPLRIVLLTLADENFRQQADKDYVAARSCYRMNLREQFLWASLQACEKYLKATLLFNEKSARYDPKKYNAAKGRKNKEFGHNASWLFEVVKRDIPDLRLNAAPQWLPTFLQYLTDFGANRYLTKATYASGDELWKLDEAVWILRRVCQNFDWTPKRVNLRPKMIEAAMNPNNRKTPALFRPFGAIGGFLEKTLKAAGNDPARQALVWKNMFFGNRQLYNPQRPFYSSSENPPQTRDWFYDDPATVTDIDYYVRLSP
jgi:hypothetical protein